MRTSGAATVRAPAPAAATPAVAAEPPAAPAAAALPATGTKVACAATPVEFIRAPWMPPDTALEVIGFTSPLPNSAATFAGTTIVYSVSPESATVAAVPDFAV